MPRGAARTEAGNNVIGKRFSSGIRLAAVLLAVLCLAGTAASASAETKLMVVSDPHYMDPSLYRGSELFLSVLHRGDGKLTQYGEDLLPALTQLELYGSEPCDP